MSYRIAISLEAQEGIDKHVKNGSKILVRKTYTLLEELRIHPREGTGKPEQLKNYTIETWSRKIDAKYRLVYEIRESELIVIAISAYGHYRDK